MTLDNILSNELNVLYDYIIEEYPGEMDIVQSATNEEKESVVEVAIRLLRDYKRNGYNL